MKSIPKLTKQFVKILFLSFFILTILNFIIFIIIQSIQIPNSIPWRMAEETVASINFKDDKYSLPDEYVSKLYSKNIWAIIIDNNSLKVVWNSDNLPDGIPMEFKASDISNFTRGYINNYPTFTASMENGLMVLGYPQKSFWKHIWPSWDYRLITHLPEIIFYTILINLIVIILIYILSNIKILKSIRPITNAIHSLSTGEAVHIKEVGLLSEIAVYINRTSEILKSQKYQLKKKETARANWIAGVSHDIRTPLSMIMGYADQLQQNLNFTEDTHRMATIILKQSKRIKNLINDLNLSSKLEYNMQPINIKKENAIVIVRQSVVDFININFDDKKYPIEWLTDENLHMCLINIDKNLIKRAISNLIQNCVNHNENGCKIYISIKVENQNCLICIEDNGIGTTDDQINKLNTSPHYLVCDKNIIEQRHGLGLLIVKQIVSAHNGLTVIEHSEFGGFSVKIIFPILKN